MPLRLLILILQSEKKVCAAAAGIINNWPKKDQGKTNEA